MLRKIETISVIFLSLIAILLNISCNDDIVEDNSMVLRLNNLAEPKTLDPALMTGDAEHFLQLALFEGLLNYDPETAGPIPGIAEKWESNEDLTVWTFHLRKNAVWSDGVKITADTFKKSWLRTLNPETLSKYVFMMFIIKNARAFYDGDIKDGNEIGIKVIDDYTLEVTLENPTAFFPELVVHFSYIPVPMHIVDKFGAGNKWYRARKMVSNGPFNLVKWARGQHIIMKKSETYWDKKAVKLDKIIVYPIDDINTAVEMFMNKETDWARDFADDRIDELKDMPETRITPLHGTYFYRFNTKNEYLKDKRVRNALSLAISREDITGNILKGGRIPALSLCPPMSDYEPPQIEGMNIQKAQQLMKEAGYPDGEGFPELTILYNTNEEHKRVAEAIKQMWKKNLGINVSLVNEDWQVYLDRMLNVDFEICRAGWLGDYRDPDTFLGMFLSYGDMNNTHFANEEYDALIERASVMVNPKDRLKILGQAEKILLTDMPVMPIYYYANKDLVHTDVKGWYDNVLDIHPPKNIWIE